MRKLDMIQASIRIDTLRIPPENHLEQLKGNREGQYSICTDAFDVEIADYHS